MSGEWRSRLVEGVRARRMPVLIGAGVFAGFLITWIVVMVVLSRSSSPRPPEPVKQPYLPQTSRSEQINNSAGPYQGTLPMEELFLADEPDFLPPVLLEREQRDAWTTEDVRPYWTDPLEEGAAVYQDMMSAVVDGIMERVP
ncbi:hypothetical protein AGMMS50267_15540 [Spirochaetia bacterium]|nr:hypothetical protein AGMMS50267_15540 [Spirochaetia bacterium]